MNILHVCAELFPLLKTGGLADVTGALPKAQANYDKNVNVRLLLPGFPSLLRGVHNLQKVTERDTFAGPIKLLHGQYDGLDVYLIESELYNREGSPYHDENMLDYMDNYLRFALLGFVACELARGLDYFWRCELVHAHDWHAGLACAYLAACGRPARCVFTVHNLAYPGLFQHQHLAQIDLPAEFFNMHGLEFYGQISYLKAGLFFADHITTVSPTYAQEITTQALGCKMEDLLKDRYEHGLLTGILNGVDNTVWNPAIDANLSSPYSIKRMRDKSTNKAKLQVDLKLQVSAKKLIFGVVSRLTEQKGLDLILDILPDIIKSGGQLVLLGAGDADLQERFRAAMAQYQGQVSIYIGYDNHQAHQIIAGVDVILVPSRFEPCGLTQLYGLKYGTLPLVRYTGGLADTVVDCSLDNMANGTATGFVFNGDEQSNLQSAIQRAFALWDKPKAWKKVQLTAMQRDVSWKPIAREYLELYQKIA
ncbi:glycogen synthase [Gammaproteobacteria bacterium]|nr:glycogen synthase [Gammaproteobacteria bacterium]